MSQPQFTQLAPFLAFALMLLFRACLFVFYVFQGMSRKERKLWLFICFFWGFWSMPFWYVTFRVDMKELEKDFARFKLITWLFDRRTVLNTLGVYFSAQAVSVMSLFPLLIVLLLVRYESLSLEFIMKPWILLLIIMYLNITVMLIIYIWGIKPGYIDLKTMGFESKGWFKWIMVGGLLGIVLLTVSYFGETFVMQFMPSEFPTYLNPESEIFGTKSLPNYILLLIGAGLIAPIGEELFFRGYMYTLMEKRNGPYFAMVVSSLIFAGWHLNIILLPLIVAAALVISFIRYKTGSLIPCIIIHMMNNILAVSYFYFFG